MMERAIVIDDSRAILRKYQRVLEERCYSVDTATDGKSGYLKVAERLETSQPYALAFIDVIMEGWSGVETVYKIREHTHYPEIIVITALELEEVEKLPDDVLLLRKELHPAEIIKAAECMAQKWNMRRTMKTSGDSTIRIHERIDEIEKRMMKLTERVTAVETTCDYLDRDVEKGGERQYYNYGKIMKAGGYVAGVIAIIAILAQLAAMFLQQ